MTLRDYQQEAVSFLVPRRRGFVVAPAGAGKTVIAAQAASRVCRPGWVVHWLANTIEQVQQAEAAIGRTEGAEGVTFKVSCVAALPSLADANLVIVDEAHHTPAATWMSTLQSIPPTAVLWGLSATPFGDDPIRNASVELAFAEFFKIDRARIEASGHLIKGAVTVYDLDRYGEFDDEIDAATAVETARRCRCFPSIPRFEHERRAAWQITQEKVQANAARNAAVIQLATAMSAAGESVLVLVHSIEHGQRLAELIPNAACVYSKLPKKKRAELIEGLRSGSLTVLVATSLADEGLDVPRASRLILVAGGRSAGKLEQRAGRVLRPFEGKNGGLIFDFLDRGARFAHAQARARIAVYEKLGYNPKIISLAS